MKNFRNWITKLSSTACFGLERHYPFNDIIIQVWKPKYTLIYLLQNREGNVRLCTGATELDKSHTHPYHVDMTSSALLVQVNCDATLQSNPDSSYKSPDEKVPITGKDFVYKMANSREIFVVNSNCQFVLLHRCWIVEIKYFELSRTNE